jgi:peptidylprolyl isomerase
MTTLKPLLALLLACACATTPEPAPAARSLAQILEQSPASDWRRLDPANTLYMELPSGRVVIELAPHFAPRTVDNIRTLVREKYFDGLWVQRVQDNFVAQWGDPDEKKPLGSAHARIAPEFTRAAAGFAFDPLPDRDVYAPQTGYSNGFPAARDPANDRAWLVHCYATVGVGRANDEDSGNGAELYAVIGNAPRLLDRNITVVGRIVKGIELLSTLPRGTGNLGFYEKAEQRVPIRHVRFAADVPEAERTPLELLRTGSDTFRALLQARRFRKDDWYKVSSGAIDVCANTIPSRIPK